jgi:acetylornithine deacetylase/succinyl-diaminopimelate desuccinylase-like protein
MPSVRVVAPLGLFVLLLTASLVPGSAHAQSAVDAARTYRQAHEAQILRDYAAFLQIPNVASDSVNIRRNARHIQEQFAERGVTLDVLTVASAPPIVTGRIDAPNATRTIGIYVHYDGQPVDADRWTHGPWTPTLYTAALSQGGEPRPLPEAGESVAPEARLYARGAGDDKAPIAALLATLDAFDARDIAPTSNIVFLFDGEEERGSPHLDQYLTQYRSRFADVDLWLFCDGPVHQSRTPQIVFGVRGVTGLEVTVYGASRPLHSGHYGNWAPVPGQMLADLLDSMKSVDGEVLIDGFYDTVAPLTDAERAAIDNLPRVDTSLKEELALARTEGGGERLEKRLLLPSLTIRGLASGNVGAKARNIIPATATAALGVRLVKGNEPSAMLDRVEQHIRDQGYHIVRESPSDSVRRAHPMVASVTRGAGYPASRVPMDQPLANDVIAAAERASGQEVLRVPTLGGTLPVFLFEQVLDTPAIIVPIANHDNNQHAPDENIRMANLWYGVDLYAALLTMPVP